MIADGDYLEIEGADVWTCQWNQLDVGTLQVPHPSYPQQRHTLWINQFELSDRSVLFASGELSNNLWCFYVPLNGQPDIQTKGMTVNEKLHHFGLLDSFDKAIASHNTERSVDILILSGFTRKQATESVEAVLSNPDKYGYN